MIQYEKESIINNTKIIDTFLRFINNAIFWPRQMEDGECLQYSSSS